jgi:NADPH2:quinone reductase
MTAISIPQTMRGVQIEKIGGPEVLQYKTDLPVPVPRDGEVLVKNDFIGINYVDVFVTLLPCLHLNTSIS